MCKINVLSTFEWLYFFHIFIPLGSIQNTLYILLLAKVHTLLNQKYSPRNNRLPRGDALKQQFSKLRNK